VGRLRKFSLRQSKIPGSAGALAPHLRSRCVAGAPVSFWKYPNCHWPSSLSSPDTQGSKNCAICLRWPGHEQGGAGSRLCLGSPGCYPENSNTSVVDVE